MKGLKQHIFYRPLRLTRIFARILAKRKRYDKDGVGADEYFAITALVGIRIPCLTRKNHPRSLPKSYRYLLEESQLRSLWPFDME